MEVKSVTVSEVPDPTGRFDAVIVGAGFAGLALLHRLRLSGFSAIVLEAGQDVGGTWYWNRYPGARCDVESVDYQLAFPGHLQEEWEWTERYAGQPEIERYLSFVADRLDLRRDIRFNERVVSATFSREPADWDVATEGGTIIRARFCILATGCLSSAQLPDIAGVERFSGDIYHTGMWPADGVQFASKRVAVIGTGSSGVQVIPLIAEDAGQLYVLQRTPNFVFPAFNRPLLPGESDTHKREFSGRRAMAMHSSSFSTTVVDPRSALEVSEEDRERQFEDRWLVGGGFGFLAAFRDLLVNEDANALAADFVRRKIRDMVGDDQLAEHLVPQGYPIGTKRIALGTNYYETFRRHNVTLVDVRADPIQSIDERGVQLQHEHIDVDVIVFATGFDAMTGAISRIDIRADGVALNAKWAAGARTFLGVTTAGFPNLFMVTGPGSPSVLTNVVVSLEYDVDWIVECLIHLRANDISMIEASPEAEQEWVDHVQAVAHATLYPRANSWYMGANIPGKPRLFLPYVGGAAAFAERRKQSVEAGYQGFILKQEQPCVSASSMV